ncbi:acyltransferase [Latilactobacillus sakei]|uniref:acyltransferase family protein n=1 Tax=Latilactobacillus sakei TaxID=1599 RepID=UPI0020924921|nr:acyltransferase [Latilactobacillus sakei]USS38239.1 acyltransferase [Latilactobacillus sakei]
MKRKNQKLYLAQMVAAICVVIIHVGTVVENPVAHFIIKSLICRIAVPFFFVNNAFFFRINADQIGYTKTWLKRLIISYTAVFVLYIPLGLQFMHQTVNIPWKFTPLLIIASYFYSGSFYHLWYFPAIIFALILVRWLVKKLGYGWTFIVSLGLFMLGSVETYSQFISNALLKKLMTNYFSLFWTTRNGLFFSPIYVLVGFFLADHKARLSAWRRYFKFGLWGAILLGIVEGTIVYLNQGIDKNFMYFTILFNFCAFGLLVTSKSEWQGLERLKPYNQGIFLLHMIPIQLFNIWVTSANTPQNGVLRSLLGIIVPVALIYGYRLVLKKIAGYQPINKKIS